MIDDPLGHLRADALDHAGAEIFADAIDGGGEDDAAVLGDELATVGGVAVPAPGEGDALAGIDRGEVADDGDEVFLAVRLDLGDGVAVLGVDVGQPLDDALQRGEGAPAFGYLVRCRRLRHRAPVLHTTYSIANRRGGEGTFVLVNA